MTQLSSRSPNPSSCIIRPAQTGDRKTIERLVYQFHQSLQFAQTRGMKLSLWKKFWAIVLTVGAVLVLLALHGFHSHVLALAIILALVLNNYRYTTTLSHFWVAECRGKVIGCAKLFRYSTHSEAYLVYVDPAWRGQGYGSSLMQRLTEEATLPLYLASQPHRIQFYLRLGFVPLPADALPTELRSRLGLDRYHEYGIVGMVFARSSVGSGG